MPKEYISPMSDGRSGIRVVHATDWDPTNYRHAEEQGRTAKAGGMKGGLGDHKMKHQKSHRNPPQKTKVNPNAQAPDYMNVSPKPLPPINEEIQKIVDQDLKSRNIQPKSESKIPTKPKKPRTKKNQ